MLIISAILHIEQRKQRKRKKKKGFHITRKSQVRVCRIARIHTKARRCTKRNRRDFVENEQLYYTQKVEAKRETYKEKHKKTYQSRALARLTVYKSGSPIFD